MGIVISFAAARDRKRVAEVNKQAEAQRDKLISEKVQEAVSAYGEGNIIGAAVALQKATDLEEKKNNPKPGPAYCNPENESRGSKYEANAGKSLPELAKLMREDIKAAKKRGQLPKALKVSVRSEYFSGGGAIRMSITALPEDQRLYTERYAIETDNFTRSPDCFSDVKRYTDEVTSWIDVLKEIHQAYNRNNSDSMSDYFDVNYYGDVGVHWKLDSARRDVESVNSSEQG